MNYQTLDELCCRVSILPVLQCLSTCRLHHKLACTQKPSNHAFLFACNNYRIKVIPEINLMRQNSKTNSGTANVAVQTRLEFQRLSPPISIATSAPSKRPLLPQPHIGWSRSSVRDQKRLAAIQLSPYAASQNPLPPKHSKPTPDSDH